MQKKRSKFWTVIFSLLPGAGHMYLGFMRRGVCLMAAFFGSIALASFFELGPLLFVWPIIWFYSFFDALNRRSLPDEAFYALQDEPMPSVQEVLGRLGLSGRGGRLVWGIVLVALGAYLLLRDLVVGLILPLLPDLMAQLVYSGLRRIPQLAVSVAIIVVGVRLIIHKKQEVSQPWQDNDESAL